jgi:hypothetical protein
VPYHREGSVNYHLMLAADVNALQMSERFFYSRCLYKLSEPYQAFLASYDLVSYVQTHHTLPDWNRHYLPESLSGVTGAELLEIARIKTGRRQQAMEKIRESVIWNTDSLAVNPIDSIFMESVKRHN